MLKVRSESSHFEGMLKESLLDGQAHLFTTGKKQLGHSVRHPVHDVGSITPLREMTKPCMKGLSSFPPILNLVISRHVLANAFQEITLD